MIFFFVILFRMIGTRKRMSDGTAVGICSILPCNIIQFISGKRSKPIGLQTNEEIC